MLGLKTKTELADEEAMIRFQKGDAQAFDILLERHSPGVLRFIAKMINTRRDQADDLLQEVFMKVIEHRKKYDPRKRFTTWLYSLARNRCIDYLRTERHRCHASLDSTYPDWEDGASAMLEIVRSGEKDQEELAINQEIRKLLNSSIQELKEEYREVFLLREVEGLALAEVAEITEVPLSTVKSRLRYAYRDLRETLIKGGYFREKPRANEL